MHWKSLQLIIKNIVTFYQKYNLNVAITDKFLPECGRKVSSFKTDAPYNLELIDNFLFLAN